MTRKEISESGLNDGDILYIYLRSNVLKIGTYWGEQPLPCEITGKRLCIGLEPQGQIFEWLQPDYIKTIEVVSATTINTENSNESKRDGTKEPPDGRSHLRTVPE